VRYTVPHSKGKDSTPTVLSEKTQACLDIASPEKETNRRLKNFEL